MTIAELKKLLDKYPDSMEVITSRYSDYVQISESDFKLINGVPNYCWIMRSHPTMSEENKANEKTYLHLTGN